MTVTGDFLLLFWNISLTDRTLYASKQAEMMYFMGQNKRKDAVKKQERVSDSIGPCLCVGDFGVILTYDSLVFFLTDRKVKAQGCQHVQG
jgi:hypothetical protein